MMMKVILVLVMATLARCQRPSFAGMRPIGYPEISAPTTEGLGDRFGEVDVTTQRLPVEANGDKNLVDRLSKLPIDKQPFWFINWQALEAHRQKPQTYPQKPNTFVDPISPSNFQNTNIPINANPSVNTNGNFVNPNTNLGSTNTNIASPTSGTVGSETVKTNTNFVNTNTITANPTSDTVASGTLSNANSFSVPISNANTPILSNRISENAANGNVAAILEDRFSGGIEENRFPETVTSKSGTKS